jgi:hypothetical protein
VDPSKKDTRIGPWGAHVDPLLKSGRALTEIDSHDVVLRLFCGLGVRRPVGLLLILWPLDVPCSTPGLNRILDALFERHALTPI